TAAYPPICCKRSATISAPTPTSAWTGRAASFSTRTGPAAAAPPPRPLTLCNFANNAKGVCHADARICGPDAGGGRAPEDGARSLPGDVPAALCPLRRGKVAEGGYRDGPPPGPLGGDPDHGGSRDGRQCGAGAVLLGGKARLATLAPAQTKCGS